MNRKLISMSVAVAALAFGATAASADTTIIGSSAQANSQAANSSQNAATASGGGSTFILGDSAPTTNQSSQNVLTNDQEIGGGTGDTILIAPTAGSCFCQGNQQAVNSQQNATTGDGGGTGITAILGDSAPTTNQSSQNVLTNSQFIGGGTEDTVLIGGAAQANAQGVNSAQNAASGSAAAAGSILVIGDDSLGVVNQSSQNVLTNEVILGG